MMNRPRPRLAMRVAPWTACIAVAGCLLAGCASIDPAASVLGAQQIEPLVPGWERIFRLGWAVEERRGRPVVSAEITNDSPYDTTGIRLLVEGLDESGRVDRESFEAPAPGRHPRYQVRVLAYDRIERGGDGRGLFR